MNTIIQEIGKVERPLQPVTAKGWQRGFANLFRKELGQWWSTRQWWIQTIIWVFILNGITTIIMVEESDFTQVQLLQEVVQVFLMLGAMATAIGIVTSTQSAIVGEKQLGTAAWIMSKPASRSAFGWAKWLAYALGFGVTAVLIPTIIFLIETRQLVAAPLSLGLFLQGVGLLLLSQLFYLSLTLMLGTLYNSRGPITGIGIALIIGGMFFKGMLPPTIVAFTPWLLGDIGSALAVGAPLPPQWGLPIVLSAVWVVLFMAVALWRFAREEF
jgi:ABC-2 type transport system permease protein